MIPSDTQPAAAATDTPPFTAHTSLPTTYTSLLSGDTRLPYYQYTSSTSTQLLPPRSVGVQLSKENRENRGGYSSGPELTRILPACPSSRSPAPCPVLARRSPHPTKSPPPLPHLHFLPLPSTLFQTSGFKPPPAQQQPTFQQPRCGGRAVLAAPDPPTLESLLAGKQAGARHGGRS